MTGLSLVFLKLFSSYLLRFLKGKILRSSGNMPSVLYALVKEKRDPEEENRFFFIAVGLPKSSFVLSTLNHG